jgi:hypothetical protein
MPLSLHIAQGNTRRLAGRKGRAKLPAKISVLRLGLISRARSAVTNILKPRREMRHRPPALEKQPITESPTMRSFVSNDITIPIVFKAIRYSHRIQIWNRQASIIMDLTTLALRHGWHCLSRV